jgi:hypothetical protein
MLGVSKPEQRVAVIRSWNTSTLLVRNGEFTKNEIALIREFAHSRSFDTSFFPSMPASDANRFNRLDQPFLYDGVTALLSDDADEFTERYKFHIAPATDDKPYFFHFFKWSTLPEVMALRKRGGAALIEWGYLILIATAIQAALAGAILILLPLSRIRRSWPRGTGARMGGYFFLLGLAFLFVEIAFIQKFIRWHFSIRPFVRDGTADAFSTTDGARGHYQDRLVDSPNRTAGILHGHAIPDRSESGRRQRARLHPLGLGSQRLCVGDERVPGNAPGNRVWIYGGCVSSAWLIRRRSHHNSRLNPGFPIPAFDGP